MRKFFLAVLLALGLFGLSRSILRRLFAGPYPTPVSKDLYASDFRGENAPPMNIVKWLTPAPNTAGKIILIDFWATWCGPCRAAIPELNALQQRFKDDLVVIGLGDETPETINAFRQQIPMNYAVATDPTGSMRRTLRVQGIPNVFILSTDGVIRWQGLPMSPEDPLTGDTLKAIINADPGIAKRHASEQSAAH